MVVSVTRNRETVAPCFDPQQHGMLLQEGKIAKCRTKVLEISSLAGEGL